jgi:hypothetical protein
VMYKFDVLAIARVIVSVALCKYKIVFTGNRVLFKETNFMSGLILILPSSKGGCLC